MEYYSLFSFFILAYFLNDKSILCLRKGNILILSIIILFTVITLHFQYGEFSIFKEISIINNKLLNYILSFVLSLLLGVAILYFSLSSNKLESIGKNALGIYLIHPIICFIILSLLKYLNIQLNITLVILLTLITITISLLLSKIPFVHWFLVPVVNFGINKK